MNLILYHGPESDLGPSPYRDPDADADTNADLGPDPRSDLEL